MPCFCEVVKFLRLGVLATLSKEGLQPVIPASELCLLLLGTR